MKASFVLVTLACTLAYSSLGCSLPTSPDAPADDCGCTGGLPVCGDDLNTYASECSAKCASRSVYYRGPCIDFSGCVCPDIYQPVCGTDGKTYSSACHLSCDSNGAAVAFNTACSDDGGANGYDYGNSQYNNGVQ